MTQTKAPASTPSPTKESLQPHNSLGDGNSIRKDFFIVAVNMSWQLAVAVLLPILGGYALDQKFDTSPLLIIIGFVLALGGMIAVLWSNSQKANAIGARHGGSSA